MSGQVATLFEVHLKEIELKDGYSKDLIDLMYSMLTIKPEDRPSIK